MQWRFHTRRYAIFEAQIENITGGLDDNRLAAVHVFVAPKAAVAIQIKLTVAGKKAASGEQIVGGNCQTATILGICIVDDPMQRKGKHWPLDRMDRGLVVALQFFRVVLIL
ncbi:hypothetical protein CU102_27840 [Phyllobacterium brassicacearum]|uniref:Uncharacterized protein n=1 Tax=Phyllobacterium brassicacearum TaxID=314235 RepID=A0A2P7AXV4_9HYPH|nr:hypothetical protein [Phyllobacterium brassicacearum]PSH59042.1 hypothetical protein CU102_27840 [Phyllobacterium brassicacearum]TDQ08918.1 hypothetical protein DEV91_1612 [Phyllobacterium brassicacearum]